MDGGGIVKALIRNKGETLTESMDIGYIDWNTGAPLTNEAWCGGPYRLVQNYVAPSEDHEETYEEIPVDPVVEENEDDYVVINGVRYSKDELRSLIE